MSAMRRHLAGLLVAIPSALAVVMIADDAPA